MMRIVPTYNANAEASADRIDNDAIAGFSYQNARRAGSYVLGRMKIEALENLNSLLNTLTKSTSEAFAQN